MTVEKNMGFGLKLRHFPKEEIRQRVGAAAELLGITDLLKRLPKALSGGQRQRVAVGRAIVRQPQVFLFDEPLSNLDAKLRVQMRAEISKLHTRLQSTMIYVTHDQVEAMTMGDRIVVMLDGVIQQVAAPLELYHAPRNKFVAGFIGSPPMNMISGTVLAENGAMRFRDDINTVSLLVAKRHQGLLERYLGKKVTLGIRPEDLHSNAEQTEVDGKTIRANVDVVEPMGAEIYLYVDLGGQPVTARIKVSEEPLVNTAYVLDADMEKAHFFDVDTELTIA